MFFTLLRVNRALMHAGIFLLYADNNFLLSKFCLKKEIYDLRMKFFTLLVNRALLRSFLLNISIL